MLVRAELVAARWTLPVLGPPPIDNPLWATGISVEGRYKIAPGVTAALRGDHLGFNNQTGTYLTLPWDAPVSRVEGGVSWAATRHVILRGSIQYNSRTRGPIREQDAPGRAGDAVVLMRAGAGVLAGCLAMTAVSAGQPRGASVRGRVELPRVPVMVERRPASGELGEGPPRDAAEWRRAVVYFETAPKGAFEAEDVHAQMDQRNETFVPHLLAVTVGTTVDFPNDDRTYHNVFSLSKTKRFDLGRYAAGRSKSVRFDRPGVVRVFCEIHSHMNAFILVFTHRFFGVTDPDGRYQIDGVPPGTYTLVSWVEGTVRDSRSITVTPDSRVVEADFPLR